MCIFDENFNMNKCVAKRREESGIFGFINVGEIYDYMFSNKMVNISCDGMSMKCKISDFDKYFEDVRIEIRMKKLEILGI